MDRAERFREIQVVAGSGDRRRAAQLLLDGFRAGELDPGQLRDLIPDIWVRLDPPVAPRGPLTEPEWIELYESTGYFVGPPTLPFAVPDPARLYRAAPLERARGMCWCTHREMAERFVPNDKCRGDYRIWTTVIPRAAMLAALCRSDDVPFHLPRGTVREIVVNPARLPGLVEDVTTPPS